MNRRPKSLLGLTARLPWWGGLLLGLGLYVFVGHILPLSFSSPLQRALVPALTVVGYLLAGSCAVGAAVGFAVRMKQKWLYDGQRTLDQIRTLGWSDFEHLMAEAFRREGYAASLTDSGADGGVDIRLTRDGALTLVQCKQWRTRRVGVGPVRELAGVVAAMGANGGIFVCSGSYTAEAQAFAERAGIRLVDGNILSGMLRLERQDGQDSRIERCPRCGEELVRRVARRGRGAGEAFLGCSAFPRCRYTCATRQSGTALR